MRLGNIRRVFGGRGRIPAYSENGDDWATSRMRCHENRWTLFGRATWLSSSCPACGQFGSLDLRTLDAHPSAAISSPPRSRSSKC